MPPGRLVHTAPESKARSVNPDALSKFLDRGTTTWATLGTKCFGNAAATSAEPRPMRMQTIYDPSLSWEGLSVHPHAFSKLDLDPRVQGRVALAGARVIETEKALPGGVFQGVTHAGRGVHQLDATVDQHDCHYEDGAAAPIAVARRSGGALSLTYSDQRFYNMKVESAVVGVRETPGLMLSAVRPVPGGIGELSQFLLTPSQRKLLAVSELEGMRATETAKRAEGQRRHLVALMRDRYPQGAMRVDGVDNTDSEVYGARARSQAAFDEKRAVHADGRRQRLNAITMQEPRFGHDPFKHNEEFLGREETKFMQAKAQRPTAPPDTHDRLFGSACVSVNLKRTQSLRDRDLAGKDYSILSKARVEVWPPSQHSRPHDYAFLEHPSQASVERPRLLQGAVPPGDRSTGIII
jgi:hypothetical protein